MKTLLERRHAEPSAALAIGMFCYQLRKQIGAFSAAMGGLDLLVFTGGIGERAAPVRWEACSGLEHLGMILDRDEMTPMPIPLASTTAGAWCGSSPPTRI